MLKFFVWEIRQQYPARRKLTTVINNCDAPIRKPLRLLRQKLGRAQIELPKSAGALSRMTIQSTG
jgi:hypothetical protein